MAGVAGFEPATGGFGDRCSTGLSYTPALPYHITTTKIGIKDSFKTVSTHALTYLDNRAILRAEISKYLKQEVTGGTKQFNGILNGKTQLRRKGREDSK